MPNKRGYAVSEGARIQWDMVHGQKDEKLEEGVFKVGKEVELKVDGSGITKSIIKGQGKIKRGIRNV